MREIDERRGNLMARGRKYRRVFLPRIQINYHIEEYIVHRT